MFSCDENCALSFFAHFVFTELLINTEHLKLIFGKPLFNLRKLISLFREFFTISIVYIFFLFGILFKNVKAYLGEKRLFVGAVLPYAVYIIHIIYKCIVSENLAVLVWCIYIKKEYSFILHKKRHL